METWGRRVEEEAGRKVDLGGEKTKCVHSCPLIWFHPQPPYPPPPTFWWYYRSRSLVGLGNKGVQIFLPLIKALDTGIYSWNTMFLSAHITICVKYLRGDVFLSYRCIKEHKDDVDIPKSLSLPQKDESVSVYVEGLKLCLLTARSVIKL